MPLFSCCFSSAESATIMRPEPFTAEPDDSDHIVSPIGSPFHDGVPETAKEPEKPVIFTKLKLVVKPEAKLFVAETIAQHKIVLFSKSRCSLCQQVKNALGSAVPDIPAHCIELDMRTDLVAIQEVLLQMCGSHTVPRVFVRGQSIGMAKEVLAAQEAGELAAMIHGILDAPAPPDDAMECLPGSTTKPEEALECIPDAPVNGNDLIDSVPEAPAQADDMIDCLPGAPAQIHDAPERMA